MKINQSKTMKSVKKKLNSLVFKLGGSWNSVFVHIIIFAVWLLLGFPQNTLTLVVSLEAIILSVLILKVEKEEQEKISKETKYEREKDRAVIEQDLQTDEYTKDILHRIEEDLREVKKTLKMGKE